MDIGFFFSSPKLIVSSYVWEFWVFWDKASKKFKNWYVNINTYSDKGPDSKYIFGFAGHTYSLCNSYSTLPR